MSGKLRIFHVGTSMPLAREDPPFFVHLVTGWDAFISIRPLRIDHFTLQLLPFFPEDHLGVDRRELTAMDMAIASGCA